MPLPPEFTGGNGGQVPIVGLALKAHVGYAMATFTCLCRPGNEPQLLRGTDLMQGCPHCRKIYRIVKVTFDATTGDNMPTVMIAPVGMAADPPRA